MPTPNLHRFDRLAVVLVAAHMRARGAMKAWTEREMNVNAINRILCEIWHNQEVSE